MHTASSSYEHKIRVSASSVDTASSQSQYKAMKVHVTTANVCLTPKDRSTVHCIPRANLAHVREI